MKYYLKWKKHGLVCNDCGTTEKLTRHHRKNMYGKRTGRITILCRSCHDKAEEIYRLIGIIGSPPISDDEKLQLDYMNGLIPFYSLYGKMNK